MSDHPVELDERPSATALRRVDPREIIEPDPQAAAGALAHILGTGDLYQLTNEQRVAHYLNLCRSAGLNPLSKPYEWIEFKEGENSPPVLTLYFKATAAAQALRNHHISVHYPRKEIVGELFVCEAHGTAPDGREGVGTKYVPLVGKYGRLAGRHLSNALMSAESGALRRLALNMGLVAGPDPDSGGAMRPVYVDGSGAVLEQPTEEQRHLIEHPDVARVLGEPTFETTVSPEGLVDLGGSQAAKPEELEWKRRTVPRQSFRPSDEQVKQWLGAWFAAVKGSSLDDDDARHRYVEQWTAAEGWPKARQTHSLKTMFARCTERDAGDFLQHVRALVEDERRANAEALAEHHRSEQGSHEGPRTFMGTQPEGDTDAEPF